MTSVPKQTEFQEFIEDSRTEYGWTDDLPLLMQHDYHYVFIYDNKRGKHSNYFLVNEDAEFFGNAWTKSKIYEILNVQTETKTYQLASLLGQDHLLGELWMIPTESLLDLDCDQSHLHVTKRLPISVMTGSGQTVGAWIYLVNSSWLDAGKYSTTRHTGSTYVGDKRFIELY